MITYRDSLQNISTSNLHGFFVGWPNPPSPETLLRLLKNSNHFVLAEDEETGHIGGFITAISDDVLSAYIPFLEVLPAYQGKGIGRELARRMLKKLSGLYMVDLICDADLQPFYERLGMRKGSGMMLRNLERQSGE
jgi:ribosomal protein S18 acetylase RimI-like enzyme